MAIKSFLQSLDKIICPPSLITEARKVKKLPRVAIAGAGSEIVMDSAKRAFEAKIMIPVFVGQKKEINGHAKQLDWNISDFNSVDSGSEEESANIAAALCGTGDAEILMKGDVHSDVFIKSVITSKNKIRTSNRLIHIFYITPPNGSDGLMISDAAVNIVLNEKSKKKATAIVVDLLRKLGIARPKVAFLSASESIIESMPSTVEAKKLCDWSKENISGADFSGPLALDMILSNQAARIKGLDDNKVSGKANGVIVPDIVSGNTLFKSLVYLGAGCAAGLVTGAKVPLILTSRADPPAARLASIALASISQS